MESVRKDKMPLDQSAAFDRIHAAQARTRFPYPFVRSSRESGRTVN